MNDYGYFLWKDSPNNPTGTITENFLSQTGSQNIEIFNSDPTADGRYRYYDFASFEQNEFDFNKPIYIDDPMSKMACTSRDISNENGEFYQEISFEVTPSEAYSGSGFTLKTYNSWYRLKITVTDEINTRSKEFDKTSDEFYPFIYDGVTYIKVEFLKTTPYHFIKVIGFNFGTIRQLDERDLVEEPEIITHFSLTNEEFELDTLNICIRGTKEDFNVLPNELITYVKDTETRDFVISNYEYNENGTVSISAYDLSMKLDTDYGGTMRKNEDVSYLFDAIGPRAGVSISIGSDYENDTFSGTLINDQTAREALRKMLQGIGCWLVRGSNNKWYVDSLDFENPTAHFSEADMTSVPEHESDDIVTTAYFSRHYYQEKTSEGKVEAFNGYVPVSNDETYRLEYDEPYSSHDVYYVASVDSGGNDNLQPVDTTKFVTLYSGYYIRNVKNTYYTQRIVIKGYPYSVSYYKISETINNAIFADNEVSISDCTMSNDNIEKIRNFLVTAFSYREKLIFDSLKEYECGMICDVNYNDKSYVGCITQKKDSLCGIYSYEVICKEVRE